MTFFWQNQSQRSVRCSRRRGSNVATAFLEQLEPRVALDAGGVSRPQLDRSVGVYVAASLIGPSPVVFEFSELAGDGDQGLVVKAVANGVVEKFDPVSERWRDVSTIPTSSSPQVLMGLLQARVLRQGERLRWIPAVTNTTSGQKAFELISWDGGVAAMPAEPLVKDCGSDGNSAEPNTSPTAEACATERNNLFSQPPTLDSTCGVRQLLLAEKVLQNDDRYFADVFNTWKKVYEQTQLNYPNGIPADAPIEELTARFQTPLPPAYDIGSVEAADGGPQSLPSSVLSLLKENGLQLTRYFIDEASGVQLFPEALIQSEIALWEKMFPNARRVDIVPAPAAELREHFREPSSYYIVLIHDGAHWIGVTSSTVYDSLDVSPRADASTFGKYEIAPRVFAANTFAGLAFEIRKQ
jgi:hypothetical protein